MKNIIKYIKKNYKRISKDTYFIERSKTHALIAMVKPKNVLFIEKFIYRTEKGDYIRVLHTTDRHVRIYLDEVPYEE